jgi:hypothetical protein
MRIMLIAAAAAAILVGGAAAMLAVSDHSLALAGSTTTSTSPAVAPARPVEDVSGPCDEAEHANDPRCAGSAANRPAAKAKATRREDRAEHRQRGRHGRDASSRTGATHDADDDRGGDDDHRGGGNSGPGGGDDDHGGHGRDHAEDD